MRILVKITAGFAVVMLLLLAGSYFLVSLKGAGTGNMYYSVDEMPVFKFGVVLGTSRFLRSGSDNPYFKNRMKSAAQLYHAGKIEKMLLSGDFSPPYYDEPGEMKRAIMELGVPEDNIMVDTMGFRTYASIIRASQVFGLDSFVIISQSFHAERAVFIARESGIYANGFAAEKPERQVMWIKSPYFREVFARMRSIWDCYFVTPEIDLEHHS